MADSQGANGMGFAKTLLSKYGWKEGQGLGRTENGITQALRPRLKFDKTGIGHDAADTFTNHWWEKAFNSAADNINVTKTKDGVVAMTTDAEAFEISAQRVSTKKRERMLYNNFVKTSTLTKEGSLVDAERDPLLATLDVGPPAAATILSDEELFKICGGRTAHKGARHGLGLSGKLARIEEQERRMLLKSSESTDAIAESTKKKKKKSKRRLNDNEESIESICAESTVLVAGIPRKSKKKKISQAETEKTEDCLNCVVSEDSALCVSVVEDKLVRKRTKSKRKQDSCE